LIVNRAVALVAATIVSLILFAPERSLGQQGGVYTQQQAAQGESTYNSYCSGCHGQNLEGADGPTLTGASFLANYPTAADLYAFISKQMPGDNPGSLKPDEYLNVLAFLLEKNGFPAGSTPLDPSKLSQISLKK
jgi:mono/diheme cytochrome c family protein